MLRLGLTTTKLHMECGDWGTERDPVKQKNWYKLFHKY